jgi:homopolymeric O-antigen transport system permease protein
MGTTEQKMEAQTESRPAVALESPQIRRIVPTKRRIRPLDIFREPSVVQELASRDFKIKYKQSLLGPIWLLFQPLALLGAFLIAFRGLGNVEPGTPYIVFALGGLMAWSFFQAAMTIGGASLITNFNLVRYTPCMRLAFPTASTIASLPSLAVTVIGALIAAAATGVISPRAVLLPIGFLWLFLLTIGTVMITSSLAVRFRDMISLVPFLLQLGLFVAPIGFPLSSLSEPVRILVDLNPLTGLIEGMRWALIAGYPPSFKLMGFSLLMTAAIAYGGWLLFSRLEATMADEI